jgi:hypothetical protein
MRSDVISWIVEVMSAPLGLAKTRSRKYPVVMLLFPTVKIIFCMAASSGNVTVGNVVVELALTVDVCDTAVLLVVAQPTLNRTISIRKLTNNDLNLIVNLNSF